MDEIETALERRTGLDQSFLSVVMRASCSMGDEAGLRILLFLVEHLSCMLFDGDLRANNG